MFCEKCGRQVNGNVCECGNVIQSGIETGYNPNATSTSDVGGFGWWLLGCCIPVVGLILYLVWRDEKPNTAKSAGQGALVAFILGAAYWAISFGLGMMSIFV